MRSVNCILDVFKFCLEFEGMEDVVQKYYDLNQLTSKKVLREKVFNVVKDKVDEEVMMNIYTEIDIKEDLLEDARRILELERLT